MLCEVKTAQSMVFPENNKLLILKSKNSIIMAGTSKSTEKLVNIIVCVGAAVVIFGAWAKILHKPFADFMLTVGLLTEALIFLVYAFLPPPGGELAKIAEALPKMGTGGNPALASMDKMLQEAEINPA